MAGEILNFENAYKFKLRNNQKRELYEKYEKAIWNIYDRRDGQLKKILECWPRLINNSQYVMINDELYMLNNKLNLVFKINHEKSEEKIETVDFYLTDIVDHYFRLDYLTFNKEENIKKKNIIRIAVKKPYKINYHFDSEGEIC